MLQTAVDLSRSDSGKRVPEAKKTKDRMPKSPPPRSRPGTRRQEAAKSASRDLILCDGQRRRRKEARLYESRRCSLQDASERLQAFQSQDAPRFAGWVETEFAPLLSSCREAMTELDRLERLVGDVRRYGQATGLPLPKAYSAILRAKADGTEEALWQDIARAKVSDAAAPLADFMADNDIPEEFREMFGALFDSIMDHDRDDFDDDSREGHKAAFGARPSWRPEAAQGHAEPDAQTAEGYLKALYRQLVRALHPDTNANLSAREHQLWHEVQEAYAWQDVQRLEVLLQTVTGGTPKSLDLAAMPIGHIMALRKDLERRLRAVKREISAATQDLAWDFCVALNRPRHLASLRQQVSSDIERERAELVAAGKRLQRQVSGWERSLAKPVSIQPPAKKKKCPGKPSKKRAAGSSKKGFDSLFDELFG